MTGEEFRKKAREAGVYLWMIADYAGISEPTLVRWLRGTLTPERERRLTDALALAEDEMKGA